MCNSDELKVPVGPQTDTHTLGCPTEFCPLPSAAHSLERPSREKPDPLSWPLQAPLGGLRQVTPAPAPQFPPSQNRGSEDLEKSDFGL